MFYRWKLFGEIATVSVVLFGHLNTSCYFHVFNFLNARFILCHLGAAKAHLLPVCELMSFELMQCISYSQNEILPNPCSKSTSLLSDQSADFVWKVLALKQMAFVDVYLFQKVLKSLNVLLEINISSRTKSYIGQNGWVCCCLVSSCPLPLYCVSVGMYCSGLGPTRLVWPSSMQGSKISTLFPYLFPLFFYSTIFAMYHFSVMSLCAFYPLGRCRGWCIKHVHIDPAWLWQALLLWTRPIILILIVFVL